MTGENRLDRHGHSLDPIATRCGECGGTAVPVTGSELYPERPALANKRFYRCGGCKAYVGCHDGTWHPLGSPANEHTRTMRRKAHGHFDAMWKAIQVADRRLPRNDPRRSISARDRGYTWLSKELGIPAALCHIGMMNADQARKVVDLCGPHLQKMGVKPERQN